MPATKKSLLAGIFCLGLSIILFEIALTRVFAIMMWHHFTYMVISIGLLGFGASGSLLTATRLGEQEGRAERTLVWTSLGYGVSVVLAFCFATLVRIDSLSVWNDPSQLIALLLIYLIIFVPFLLGGLGIGLALTRFVKSVDKLYFADLVGSALGAAGSVVVLKAFGSTATVAVAAAFGLLAAFCFSFVTPRRYLVLTVPGLALAGWFVLAFTGLVPSWKVDWKVPYAIGKEALTTEAILANPELRQRFGATSTEIDKLHSATAEVEVAPSMNGAPMIGGDLGLEDSMMIRARGVGQDGAAPTMLYEGAADLARFPFLDDTQAASAYVAHAAAGRSGHDVMVIGVGGGVDVLVALANGAKHVTAVELNTAMIEMVTDRYADYLGGLFTTSPLATKIDLVNSEGRAWLRSHDDKYDVIQMSGVDSYTALSGGAYTLSESYLYTVEAVHDFYSHLKPDGIVCYSRFMLRAPKAPRETLRLANIAVEGLRAAGVAEPHRHVCVLRGGVDWASTMIKQSPWTPAEITALRDFSRREGFVGLLFDPLSARDAEYVPQPEHFSNLRVEVVEPVAVAAAAGNVPALDAVRAFFVAAAEVAKGAAPARGLLPESMRAAGIADVLVQQLTRLRPAIEQQRDYVRRTIDDFRTLLWSVGDEKQAFYERYPFHVRPATDDSPFFFNFYKWSSLFAGAASRTKDADAFNYHSDFPIGHYVLLASMVQILALAVALIFLPIRKLARSGMRQRGALRVFLYFAALGLGFMLIEIALMQKLVIFLGHPTYALSVVLLSLLAAAGTGSLLSGRIAEISRKHVWLILLGILVAIVVDVFAVNHVLPLMLGAPLWLRVAAVVVLLVPTGLLLGMPFPTGMRLTQEQCPQLVPWGWAINAFFSVFGSIFCIVLSMQIGFSKVFWVAAGVYAVGMALMIVPRRGASAVAPAGDLAEAATVAEMPVDELDLFDDLEERR